MIERKPDCRFCSPNNASWEHFEEYGKSPLDKVRLHESANLVVLPDILPVSPKFHGLIVPREHRLALASLFQLNQEVGQTLHRVEKLIGRPLVFFEHGGASERNGGIQSVFHAHGHLISTEKDIRVLDYMKDVLLRMGIQCLGLEDLDPSPISNIRKAAKKDCGYLYIQMGRQGLMAYDKEDTFPSQITQRAMSRFLNSGHELDWKRIDQDEELARLSVARIASVIKSCKL